MIDRIRVLVTLARPPVAVLLGLFAATGLAEAGKGDQPEMLAKALVAVIAFLLFAVIVNDWSDEAIDRVNLPGDPRRPLAAGLCCRRDLVIVGITSGVLALAASALLHGPAMLVVFCGLVLSAAYSLRPIRVADRGAVASMLLPACYVAVPYLLGIFAARGNLTSADLMLLVGLYTGFIGRILLKGLPRRPWRRPLWQANVPGPSTAAPARVSSAPSAGSRGPSCSPACAGSTLPLPAHSPATWRSHSGCSLLCQSNEEHGGTRPSSPRSRSLVAERS